MNIDYSFFLPNNPAHILYIPPLLDFMFLVYRIWVRIAVQSIVYLVNVFRDMAYGEIVDW